MSNTNKGNTSLGFLTILGLLFITLKLCNIIDWSWGWVLFPLYFPILFVVGFIIFIVVLSFMFKGK